MKSKKFFLWGERPATKILHASEVILGREETMTMEVTAALQRKPRPVADLNHIVKSALRLRQMQRVRSAIIFTAECASNLPKVSADPLQVEKVVQALIAFAEDAVAGNFGRRGEVQLKTALHGQRVHLTVTDNGRGIHWREMQHLFGEQSRDVSLTQCAETVKDNGGDLYAWSSYGNGSVFTLELPVHIEHGLRRDCRDGLEGKRILVIDDEAHISTLMFDVLVDHGAKIDLANSGLQAVEQIRTTQYDLFICDQRMPDLNGEGLYRSIETMNPDLRHRFLFVTGDALNGETRAFFTQTGVPYIQKPFRTVELVTAAKQVLSRTQQLGF